MKTEMMEPLGGIEPPTYALPRRRYASKPQRLKMRLMPAVCGLYKYILSARLREEWVDG